MRMTTSLATIGFIVYSGLVLIVSRALNLRGTSLWVFNIALILLGAIVAAIVVYLMSKRGKPGGRAVQASASPDAGGSADIDEIVTEAERRLAATGGQRSARLSNRPAVFVIGAAGAAKTSVVLHSGIDAELLAGQVYRDNAVAPTEAGNLWLGRGVVLAEFAGKLLSDSGKWKRMVRRLQPARLASVLGGRGQAPRAVLLCVDGEMFARPGAADAATAAARDLRARLVDTCQILGAAIPVYVLFTRMDRVPFFLEYVRNLNEQEAKQVLGATLAIASADAGLYAQEQTAKIEAAFQQLFRSLSDARLEILPREQDSGSLPGIYEFPREFRKLRGALIQFLVDLCRPSQLSVSPFLRGFYFGGVRPVVVNDGGSDVLGEQAAHAAAADSPDATRIFQVGVPAAAAQPAARRAPATGPRRVPQWVFLDRLFSDVLLADATATAAAGPGTKVNQLRRALLAGCVVIGLLLSIAFFVSFLKNRALGNQVRAAAEGVSAARIEPGELPSQQALSKLDGLREVLQTLTAFRRDGAPLSYRWGLYSGDDLYGPTRRLYFDRFHKLLLAPAQGNILGFLESLPARPGPAYSPTYDALKAYLITTSNHEKSTRAFLTPVLLKRLTEDRPLDAPRDQLVRRQLNFYADELAQENMFTSANDAQAVQKARTYLGQFGAVERVYHAMLEDAAKKGSPINFNRQFPGSAETVVESYEVPPAFGKTGYEAMTAAIANPSRYFSGEAWVLGNQITAEDSARLQQEIRERYTRAFVEHWRAYVKGARVVKYGDLKDAVSKLGAISSNQSPLLALFWLASQNTAVADPRITEAMQPVHVVVPPSGEARYIVAPNQNYANGLMALQSSLEALALQPQSIDTAAGPALNNATAARLAARQLAQAFRIDADAHLEATTQKLLEDPIIYAENLLRTLGPAELNGKGKALCGQMRQLWAKYPFNPTATAQASIAEVNRFLKKPEGSLWEFYASNLQNVLVQQGGQYALKPGAAIQLNPGFIRYFNEIASLSDALYAGGSADPHFSYTLKLAPTEEIKGVGLKLDGQNAAFTPGDASPRRFAWQAAGPHEAAATVKLGGSDLSWDEYTGLWSVFQFFGQAERWQPSDKGYAVEWLIRIGRNPARLPSGKPATVRFEVAMENNAPPVLRKGFFSSFGCVGEVAK